VKFSCPQVNIRSTRARGGSCILNDILEKLSPDLQEGEARPNTPTKYPIPIDNCRATHVTAIQEIACNELEWHIASLLKTLSKACFAQQVVSKKKFIVKIIQDNKSTVAPTYTSMMVHYKRDKEEHMWFFFYNNDIE
jgi:hypothetical protein